MHLIVGEATQAFIQEAPGQDLNLGQAKGSWSAMESHDVATRQRGRC